MVPFNFTEDGVMWFESKLSAAAGTLRAEAVELRNFLLSFRCTSEEFRVVIARLVYWMANYSPPLGRLPHTNGVLPVNTG